MAGKLIVLMLDGISAEYVAAEWRRLPHLAALAERGFSVERLRAETGGTSFPGRTSMVTGVTADVSGVYANKIWDGAGFRYASPDDVRVPTVAGRAKAAGRDVAVVGYGMVRPEDAEIFVPPFWAANYVERARGGQAPAAATGWGRVAAPRAPHPRFVQAVTAAGLPTAWTAPPADGAPGAVHHHLIDDLLAIQWTAALAAGEMPPDLVLAEVNCPDAYQHDAGYRSGPADWSIAYADMLVGLLAARLAASGRDRVYNLAVMSDHGHSPIERAIRPDFIIPDATFQADGSLLYVLPRDAADLARIEAALAPYGVTRHASDHLPVDQRERIVTFAAPERTSFEHSPGHPATGPVMAPRYPSSHGLPAGHPGDDRFAVFAGPDVPRGRAATAAATQVAPTFAALLGLLLTDYPGRPVF